MSLLPPVSPIAQERSWRRLLKGGVSVLLQVKGSSQTNVRTGKTGSASERDQQPLYSGPIAIPCTGQRYRKRSRPRIRAGLAFSWEKPAIPLCSDWNSREEDRSGTEAEGSAGETPFMASWKVGKQVAGTKRQVEENPGRANRCSAFGKNGRSVHSVLLAVCSHQLMTQASSLSSSSGWNQ